MTCNKEEHEHDSSCGYRDHDLTITAKYQADITQQWLDTVGTDTSWIWDWDEQSETRFQVTMLEDKTVQKGTITGNNIQYMTYYVEDPNGNIQHNGKYFRELVSYEIHTSNMSYPTLNEEFFIVDGYDRYDSNLPGWTNYEIIHGDLSNKSSWQKNNNFYYTRSGYELQLINGERSETYTVPYTADLHEYLDKDPEYNPLGNGTFAGWYLDPEFQEPYNGDYKMPKGLVLYAKWNPVTYTVKFVDSDDTSIEYDTQTVESKGLVDVVIPEKPGYVFKGWYTENDTEFDYATQITGDLTLYAKWEANQFTTYTVKYVTPDGEEVAPETTGSGKVGSVVQAKAKKAEKEFEGYTVDAVSKTIELQPDSSLNVITFIYTKAEELKYTVKYVDEMGSDLFTEAEKTSTANYIKVTIGKDSLDKIYSMGYKPNQNFQWVNLTTGENIVKFVCTKATYSIKYELNGGNLETSNPGTYTI